MPPSWVGVAVGAEVVPESVASGRSVEVPLTDVEPEVNALEVADVKVEVAFAELLVVTAVEVEVEADVEAVLGASVALDVSAAVTPNFDITHNPAAPE